MRRFLPIALSFAAIACSKNGNDLTRFHEDGRAKPVVAVTSVIDATSLDLPWSLSEELTSMIVNAVSSNGSIYVTAKEDLSVTDIPFGNDLSWIKREFPDDQFVVFLELAEHDFVAEGQDKPGKPAAPVPFETAMSLRLAIKMRVVDVRAASPKIVLQEMIRDSFFVPKNMVPVDYTVSGWGTNDFMKSPMGLAHAQIVREISSRIADYIQLAKSR